MSILAESKLIPLFIFNTQILEIFSECLTRKFSWLDEGVSLAFKPHGLLLTAAGFPSNMVIEAGYDIPALDKYLDYVSIMAYDYYWLGGGLRRSSLIMGKFTMARGFSAYYEICDLVQYKGWHHISICLSQL